MEIVAIMKPDVMNVLDDVFAYGNMLDFCDALEKQNPR